MSARAIALGALSLLAGCVQRTLPPLTAPVPVAKPTPAPPAPVTIPNNALLAGITQAEPQPVDEVAAARALVAFRTSCPVLGKRVDSSGLTKPEDWIGPCAKAEAVTPGAAAVFFREQFDWAQIGDGKAFATVSKAPTAK